ncbi:MAG TPA: DUF721 domain-containing protein [Opitutaceae bacterium]|nr:DUF721 domain-containing protein [Opitutaceae bacterium]
MPDQPSTFSKIAEELVGDLRGVPFEEPKRQVKRPTRVLADLVEETMAKYHVGRPSAEQTIRDHWPAVVGAANAAYSHAVHIEGKRLTVIASHSVVRNELNLHKEGILERIQKLPGCAGVKTLSIRAG